MRPQPELGETVRKPALRATVACTRKLAEPRLEIDLHELRLLVLGAFRHGI